MTIMNGNKIKDCVTILNQLLKPETVLGHSDRKELLNFFVEEKIKSIKIYESKLQGKIQNVLSAIKTEKEALVKDQKYEGVARLRDLEKSYDRIHQMLEEFKRKNLAASFGYGVDGLYLIIAEGEYPHTIEELERMGLHLIFLSQTLDRMNIPS